MRLRGSLLAVGQLTKTRLPLDKVHGCKAGERRGQLCLEAAAFNHGAHAHIMKTRASNTPWPLLAAFALAGCATTVPPGRIIGATYPRHEVQVFSMGEGSLPEGKRNISYLHLRLAVKNASHKQSLTIDPRKQWISLPAGTEVRPDFAESDRQTGLLTVSPKRSGAMDLFYDLPNDTDEFEFHWTVAQGTDEAVDHTIKFTVLQKADAPPGAGIWVPTGQPDDQYYVSTLRPWAEPTHDWYWWRDSDFYAWMHRPPLQQGDETIDTPSSDITVQSGYDEWYWMNPSASVPPAYGTSGFSDAAPSPQSRGGWRHVVRRPRRAVHRAEPSRADEPYRAPASHAEEPYRAEPSRSDSETRASHSQREQRSEETESATYRAPPSRSAHEDHRTAETRPSPRSAPSPSSRENQSEASSVGRSWRRHR